MKANLKNIREVLGVHARGIKFERKFNPTNGYTLAGFLNRNALNDLDHNFHVYFKEGKMNVITPGRISVSQKGI